MTSRHGPTNPTLIDDDGAEYVGATRCGAGCQPPSWPCDAHTAERELDAVREAVYAMDSQIGTWLSDYAPGQSWLRLLQAAYGKDHPGVPTDEQIARDDPAPLVRPGMGSHR